MDTLRGNRRRAAMSQENVKRELALAPAPVASDLVPLAMAATCIICKETGTHERYCPAQTPEEVKAHYAPVESRLDGGMAPLRATSHVSGQRPL